LNQTIEIRPDLVTKAVSKVLQLLCHCNLSKTGTGKRDPSTICQNNVWDRDLFQHCTYWVQVLHWPSV